MAADRNLRAVISRFASVAFVISLGLSGCDARAEAERASPKRLPEVPVEAMQPAPSPLPATTIAVTDKEQEFRDSIVASCLGLLQELSRDAVLVEAVAQANRVNFESPEEILVKDKHWRQTSNPDDPLIRSYIQNPCADALRKVCREHPEYTEIFVMDAKSCIVSESHRTSDYWQGDEDKWTRSFNGGKGALHASEIEYDESSQAYVVQISLPVMGPGGSAVGALTASIQAKK